MDKEGITPTARLILSQPIQQRCPEPVPEGFDENNEHAMPQSQPSVTLTHIVQEGRYQQVAVMVLLSPQGMEDIQAMALVTPRHPLKELRLRWSQIFA
jgi:hypothetical protein